MRLYPASPGRRASTLAGDLALVLLLAVFAWAGFKVHDGIAQLAGIGRGLQQSGRGISSTARDATNSVRDGFDSAGGALGGLPFLGDRLKDALTGAGRSATQPVNKAADDQARRLIALGRAQERQTYRVAKLAGWLTFLLPALLLLAWKLPPRIGQIRRIGLADRTLRGGPPDILAARAAYNLPYRALARYTPDPFGDLASGRHDRLLAALAADAEL
jgi:hypothetical protein